MGTDFPVDLNVDKTASRKEVILVNSLNQYTCDVHEEESDEAQTVCYTRSFWSLFFTILVTAIGGRPKPELCFLPGRLRLTLLPKERYSNSLSVCGSKTQTFQLGGGHFTTEL